MSVARSIDDRLPAATAAGRARRARGDLATRMTFDARTARLRIELVPGVGVSIPVASIEGLAGAPASVIRSVRLQGGRLRPPLAVARPRHRAAGARRRVLRVAHLDVSAGPPGRKGVVAGEAVGGAGERQAGREAAEGFGLGRAHPLRIVDRNATD